MTIAATNAKSSDVAIDPSRLRELMAKSDGPGLAYLALWLTLLTASGWLVHISSGSLWMWPAMFVYGTVMTVPAYALSHECAHGTFVKTPWLNTLVNWITALIYFEEPNHRFVAHMRHHNYTWINGMDAQMPYATPMTFRGWLLEISGLELFRYEAKLFALNALGIHGDEVRRYTPERDLVRLKWGARLCLAIYASLAAVASVLGFWPELLAYLIIPRLLGGISMQVFTIIQHAEMEEDQHDLRRSTRSFSTNLIARFLYAEMNNHVEHHLYPKVPFHALPTLRESLAGQLPAPDRGLFRTNWKVLKAVLARSFATYAARPKST